MVPVTFYKGALESEKFGAAICTERHTRSY